MHMASLCVCVGAHVWAHVFMHTCIHVCLCAEDTGQPSWSHVHDFVTEAVREPGEGAGRLWFCLQGAHSKENEVSRLRAEKGKAGQGNLSPVAWRSSLSLPQGAPPLPAPGQEPSPVGGWGESVKQESSLSGPREDAGCGPRGCALGGMGQYSKAGRAGLTPALPLVIARTPLGPQYLVCNTRRGAAPCPRACSGSVGEGAAAPGGQLAVHGCAVQHPVFRQGSSA